MAKAKKAEAWKRNTLAERQVLALEAIAAALREEAWKKIAPGLFAAQWTNQA